MTKVYDLGEERGWIEELKECKFLIETDKDLNVSDVIEIRNKTYSICRVELKESKVNAVGVRKVEFCEEPEETNEYNFTCPYCKYEYADAWELDDEGQTECPNCGSEIDYQREVTVSYIVKPIKKAEVIKIK
jgi:DNA-directed RNA polymerase subunit RPC12/RpoP